MTDHFGDLHKMVPERIELSQRDFAIDRWAEPAQRRKILSMLCEDWLTDGCDVVGCEQIAGAVQWENCYA